MQLRSHAAFAALLCVILVMPAPSVAADPQVAEPAVPTFVEEAATAGVEHTYAGSWQFFTGGGVAVADCDGNGLPDLYFAGGSEPAGLYRNVGEPGGPLAFERLASEAAELSGVTGAYPVDIDSDAIIDFAVLRRGENVLLRGLGDCRFERANEEWGFDGGDDWTIGFSAKWEVGDTLPTLAIGNYLTIVEPGESPTCDESAVVRPASADSFGEPEALSPGYCSLSMLFSDWDRSGHRDLRVTNDRQYYRPGEGEDQLWKVRPGEPLAPYVRDDGWDKLSVFGMSIASADVTGDGYPDYYISSMAGNRLRTLADGPAQPSFTDIAYARGVDAAQPFAGGDKLPSTAWHAEFDDVNNDGRLDLYVSKGNVDRMPEAATKDPSNLFLGRSDGIWTESAADAGILHFGRTRGAALSDLNLDGLLDLVEVVRAEPVKLWRNVGTGTADSPEPMGHWLAVELAQEGPNSAAIGSWIEVRSGDGESVREVTIGGGHASGQLGPTHFGLGTATEAQVRVTWPDGEVGAWMRVGADRRLRVERGATGPTVLRSAQPGAVGGADRTTTAVPVVDLATCQRSADPAKSVARLRDEALLDAIRRDFPAPTVHARNLYDTSATMWDAWAAYDPDADGVFVTEKIRLEDPTSAREKTISYAAYGVLSHRYKDAAGGVESLRQFDELMAALCYPTDRTGLKSDSPAALGNRIARRIIKAGQKDGSRERQGYVSRSYSPVNESMIVQLPGTQMDDPKPLAAAGARTAHRPGRTAVPARPRHRWCVQGQCRRGHPLQRHARPARRLRAGHLTTPAPRQHARGQ